MKLFSPINVPGILNKYLLIQLILHFHMDTAFDNWEDAIAGVAHACDDHARKDK